MSMNMKKTTRGGAGPKDTSGGKDLSKGAKNVVAGTKLKSSPISPSANAVSKDK